MESYQFTLDLSGNSAIPSQAKIGLREVCKWMAVQAKGQRDVQITNHFHRGCFNILTGDKKTAQFLRSFSLEINWSGMTHRIGLKPAASDKPRIWVRFWDTCRGVMAQMPNAHFDGMLEAAGFVILRPTEKRKHFGCEIFNGQRSALCQRGTEHIDRNHEWIDDDGNVFKWRLEYDGQPHFCSRGCNVYHEDGKCATWDKKKERQSWGGQQKCYVVSSSMLRLASDTKDARIDAIPGAKIGHIANHVNNDSTIFAQADVVVIHAGANMDLGSVEESKPHVEYQAQELVKVAKPLVDAEKELFIIDPVAGPLVKEDPGGHHWAMIRQRMKRVAKETKATWISLQNIDWIPEEDISDDGTHYSTSGTKKVMEAVGSKIEEKTKNNLIANMEFQQKPYDAIYKGHYKFGCYRCTRIHERGACPPLPELNDSNSSNDSSVNSDNDSLENSVIAATVAKSVHDISLDSWAEDDDDDTPTNSKLADQAPAGGSTTPAAPVTAAHSSTANVTSVNGSGRPRGRPRCTSAADASVSAAAAISAFDEVASTGEELLNNLNNTKNRSESSKRNRELNEEDNALEAGKKHKTKGTPNNVKNYAAKAGNNKTKK